MTTHTTCNEHFCLITRRQFLARSAQLLGALGILQTTGCGGGPLTIGSHVWPGYEFMFLAHREGWLPPDQVRLLETASATESLKALADGSIQGAALTLDEAMRGIRQGIPLTIVLIFDISAGADVVLARPGIASVTDLKGRAIGVETRGVGALMLYQTLELAGLRAEDVTVIPVAVNEHTRLWSSDSLDALITYEPTAGKLEATGAMRLLDSRRVPATIFDVLAVNSKVTRRQSGPLRALVKSHFKAFRAWRSNPVDAIYRMASHLEVEPEQVTGLYRGLELPDLAYNRHLLTTPALELHRAVQRISEVFPEIGEAVSANSLPALFSADYLPEDDS